MVRWYRYVEDAKWEDITNSGVLRAGDNSCGLGKWLAGSETAAWQWGRALDERFPGRVVIFDLDDEVAERAILITSLDGIGQAAYIDAEELVRLRIVDIRKYEG